MNHHALFHSHLKTLANYEELLAACKKYKTNADDFAFEVNGRLKAGLRLDDYFNDIQLLQRAICATFTTPTTLYRITSDFEFTAPIVQVLKGRFRYQAFMSTADSSEGLDSIKQNGGRPLLLEIECPEGTALAPLDLFPGTEEREFLLGCGTTFEVRGEIRELDAAEIAGYIPKYSRVSLDLLQLKAVANPPYVVPDNLFSL